MKLAFENKNRKDIYFVRYNFVSEPSAVPICIAETKIVMRKLRNRRINTRNL